LLLFLTCKFIWQQIPFQVYITHIL